VTRRGRTALGYALIALGFGLFMAGPLVALALGAAGPVVILPSVLGFVVMAVGGILLAATSEPPRRPVDRPVALGCPSCGAAAPNVEGDTATCGYCGTRFLVR